MKFYCPIIFLLFYNIISANPTGTEIATPKGGRYPAYPYAEEGIVLVFSFSFTLLNRELQQSDLDLNTALSKLKEAISFVTKRHPTNEFLPILPKTKSEKYNNWMHSDGVDELSSLYFNKNNYMQQDVKAKAYEPTGEGPTFIELSNLMPHNNVTMFRIYVFTNFASSTLNDLLGSHFFKSVHSVEEMNVIPMSVLSMNYYFYSLTNSSQTDFNFCEYPAQTLDDAWPIIYLFAFSDKLSDQQVGKILASVESSVDLYMRKKHFLSKEINVLFSTFFNSTIRTTEFQNLPIFVHIHFTVFYENVDLLTISLENNQSTSMLYAKSLDTFYTHLPYSQLPLEMASDALRKPIHWKPRFVLITDFFEEYFLNHYLLPHSDLFEFKIYALNENAQKGYRDSLKQVFLLNPNNPGTIPIGRDEPEPVWMPNAEYTWIDYALIILVAIVPLCLIVCCVLVIIQKRRLKRLNWLNQLEHFKSEHIYAAYMEKNAKALEEEEEQELWEMGWDQVMMCTEQLGKGVYGEVYKGKLRIIPRWIKQADPALIGQLDMKITNQTQGVKIAVKMLPMHVTEKWKQSFMREIEIVKF